MRDLYIGGQTPDVQMRFLYIRGLTPDVQLDQDSGRRRVVSMRTPGPIVDDTLILRR